MADLAPDPIRALRDATWIAGLDDLCRMLLSSTSVVVELGSFGGESTEVFARHAGLVYAVDPWSEDYSDQVMLGCADLKLRHYVEGRGLEKMHAVEQIFNERISSHYSNVRKVKRSEADEARNHLDGSLDMVYIDTVHTEQAVRQAIERWLPKIKPGGYCAGHDYSPAWPGVVRAVNAKFAAPHHIFADTSWAVRTTG